MIIAKTHKSGNELLLAACDMELLGKSITLENGAIITFSDDFYNGGEVSADELAKMANNCTNANFFGKETINALIAAGAIEENGIMELAGVPHSQLYKLF
jgi:hypothetical protein